MEIWDGKMHEFQFAMLEEAFSYFRLAYEYVFVYFIMYTKLNSLSTNNRDDAEDNRYDRQRKPQQIVRQYIGIPRDSSSTNKQTKNRTTYGAGKKVFMVLLS